MNTCGGLINLFSRSAFYNLVLRYCVRGVGVCACTSLSRLVRLRDLAVGYYILS